MTIRQDPALQERIRSVLRGSPGLTSAQIAEALAEPHEVVSWEVVVMTHQRALRFEGVRPTRYLLADDHPMSMRTPAQRSAGGYQPIDDLPGNSPKSK